MGKLRMSKNTTKLRRNEGSETALDAFDRKILSALTEDARRTFAEIGAIAGLSAPAVFERVKRLRAQGILKGTTTRLEGAKIGKPLLAFVLVDTEGWGKGQRLMALRAFPEVEEMHSVAGDTGVILKLRTADTHALEAFLSALYAVPGVKGSTTYVVLSTYLERTIQPDLTANWPALPARA